LTDEGDYNFQTKLLQDRLDSLVIPEEDDAINAGRLLENMGPVWENASLDEKHRLLCLMLDAVYLDLAATRSVVGILPKPVFYPLFKSLQNVSENKITIYHADNAKKIEPVFTNGPSTVVVETGEAPSLPYLRFFDLNFLNHISFYRVAHTLC
jgi:hypothetical protein